MINSVDFIARLEELIQYYGFSSSSFADKIGVQRSSISHLLKGRNKPSLEFVLKIVQSFPEVNLYWLLNGKGTFPSTTPKDDHKVPQKKIVKKKPEVRHRTEKKSIEKIIIFYTDGSFEAHTENKESR